MRSDLIMCDVCVCVCVCACVCAPTFAMFATLLVAEMSAAARPKKVLMPAGGGRPGRARVCVCVCVI